MVIDKSELIRFFGEIERLEGDAKEITEEIKNSFSAFALNNEINPKALKKAYRNFKEHQKNAQEFIEVDTEADALTQKVIPEYAG